MFKKILVPLDGSELAEKIIPNVVDLAKSFNAEVTLLNVCYFPVPMTVAQLPEKVENAAEAEELRSCASYLEKLADRLRKQGLNVKLECLEGVAAREIVAYADTNKMDLIAMATHGKGEVAWVLGSTAEKVVSHATVPVLLYRVVEIKPPMLKVEVMPLP
jgi:nucleotide-binding universal stress UspA family protein